MSGAFAEGPAPIIANRIDDGDADEGVEIFQVTNDERAMRPRTGEGDVEVIAAGLERVGRGIVG